MSRSMCRSCSARCWRPRAAARRAVRRLHARARRPHARVARGGRDTRDRAGPRSLGTCRCGRGARGVWRARRVRARRLPAAAGGARRRAVSSACRACWPTSGCRRCSSTPRAGGSASGATSRSTCGWTRRTGPTAADLVNQAGEEELANVIYEFGEERYSRRDQPGAGGARGPSPPRANWPRSVRRAVPTRGWQRIDPATRTFQALRIWVNRELDGLDRFVSDAADRLRAWRRVWR